MKHFLAAAAFLTATPAMAQDQMTLLLDWFVNPNHGPVIIAEERGYFADAGLEIEVIPPADPSDPPKLVAAGRGDLALSYQPQLHLQVHEGLPLTRVGTLIATPLNCLLVLEDSPVQTPGDLKGKKIGFSVGGVEEAMLAAILAEDGVGLDEVELVNVNWSLSPSLMSGQVDAVLGAYRNFELNQMDIEGVAGRCFAVEEIGLPAYDELIFVANTNTMDKEKIARFLGAIEKATQYIVNHPDDAWDIFRSTSRELDDELNSRAWRDTLPRFATRPQAMSAGRYSTYEKFLFEAGLIPSINPVSMLAIDVTAE